MHQNVGEFDRSVRLVAGSVFLIVGLGTFAGVLSLGTGTVGLVLAAIATLGGLVMVVTALTQRCLLYSVLGFDTCRSRTTVREAAESK